MKKLFIFATCLLVAACANKHEDTLAHHCQRIGETGAHCVNWVDGKYNSHYHENCNELVDDACITTTEEEKAQFLKEENEWKAEMQKKLDIKRAERKTAEKS
jgi:hypothetical protein